MFVLELRDKGVMWGGNCVLRRISFKTLSRLITKRIYRTRRSGNTNSVVYIIEPILYANDFVVKTASQDFVLSCMYGAHMHRHK